MHACHLRVCYFDCRSKGISKTLQYPDKSEGRNIITTTVGKSSFSFYIMSCHRNPHAYFSLNFSHTHFGISIEHPTRSSVVIEALLAKLSWHHSSCYHSPRGPLFFHSVWDCIEKDEIICNHFNQIIFKSNQRQWLTSFCKRGKHLI